MCFTWPQIAWPQIDRVQWTFDDYTKLELLNTIIFYLNNLGNIYSNIQHTFIIVYIPYSCGEKEKTEQNLSSRNNRILILFPFRQGTPLLRLQQTDLAMDFHKIAHAVQHGDVAWFLKDQTARKCLGVSHKKTGDTVLHLACRFGRRDLLEVFTSCEGVDLQISNYEGKKPLHEAAQFGQLDCVDFLLQTGVQVDCLKRADWCGLFPAFGC